MKRILLGAALVVVPFAARAQAPMDSASNSGIQYHATPDGGSYGYTQPGILESVRDIPGTLGGAARMDFRASQWKWMLGVATSTAVLYQYDRALLIDTRHGSSAIGLPPNHPSYNLRIGVAKIELPTTVGSGIYFLGDGIVTVGIAGGFYATGRLRGDNRAMRTASELTNSLLTLGIVTQVMKHSFGRQTPSEATSDRGEWHPFPPLKKYNKNVPYYDAFPSGHLATAVATVEVLAMNYPEHRWVRPIGYTLSTALSVAMVNNGVHWWSDYPLAIAIGGSVAHVAAQRGRTRPGDEARAASGAQSRAPEWTPLLAPGIVGARLTF